MIFNIQLEAKAKGMKEADEKAEAEATLISSEIISGKLIKGRS